MGFVKKKKKKKKDEEEEVNNHLFNSTLYDRHNAVQVCGLYGTMQLKQIIHSYSITTYHTPYPRKFSSPHPHFIGHCFAYKNANMNGNTTRTARR